MSTPQTQAVGLTNSLIALVNTVTAAANAIDDLYKLWTEAQTGQFMQEWPTRTLEPDGTLGAVDPAPDLTHPLDIVTTASTATDGTITPASPALGITRALAYNDIVGIITSLTGVRDVVRGQGVTANGATVQLFAKCLGS